MCELVTFLLVTYNQERFIKKALDGAVNQDYPNLEIIISDDASSDSTYSIIIDYIKNYRGQHKICAYRNEQNLGLVGNLNKALSYSKANYIVLAAGDDVSYSFRCSYSVKIIKEMDVASVSFAYNTISSDGSLLKKLNDKSREKYILGIHEYFNKPHFNTGCARIIRRDLIEKFGYLDDSCPTEDTTFNLRSLMLGGLGFCQIPVLDYRIHGANISKGKNRYRKIKSERIYKQYLADLEMANEMKYISAYEYSSIKKYIDDYLERESTIQHMYEKENALKRFLFLINTILVQRISWKTKHIVIRKYFSWLKNNL